MIAFRDYKTVLVLFGLLLIPKPCALSRDWTPGSGLYLPVHISEFHPLDGKIKFSIDQSGYVRIRYGIVKGAYLGTIVNWEYFKSGTHELKFDPSICLRLNSQDMDAAAVGIRFSGKPSESEPTDGLLQIQTGSSVGQAPRLVDIISNHQLAYREATMDAEVLIWVNDTLAKGLESILIKDDMIVRIDMCDPAKRRFRNDGFKIEAFINGMEIMSAWDGRLPCAFVWKSKNSLSEESMLSVSLQSSYDAMAGGYAILKFNSDNEIPPAKE